MGSNTLVKFLPLVLALVANTYAASPFNERLIIGILTQPPPQDVLDVLEDKNYTSYISASYVKYVESAGARVVPIFIDQDDLYYKNIASYINGILFPGGVASISIKSGYGAAAKKLYSYADVAFRRGINFPIWGISSGFEMLAYLAARDSNWFTDCNAQNTADKLTLQEDYIPSGIFTPMSDRLLGYITDYVTTVNFHSNCLTPQNFYKSGMSSNFKMLTTSFDSDGIEYVSLMEHVEMPFYGSQFHPEMNPFQWPTDDNHNAIPHDLKSIEISRYFSDLLSNEARLNYQHFPSDEEETKALINNYDPIFTGRLGSTDTESYLFR